MKPHLSDLTVQTRRGFTLVELLVVIVIVIALAAISFISVSRMRSNANSAKAVQSLRQIGSLVLGLASESGGKLPDEGGYPDPSVDPPLGDRSWDGYVLAYMGATDVEPLTPPRVPLSYESLFWHGNDTKAPITGGNSPSAKRSFVYLRAVASLPVSSISDPTRTGLLGEHPWRTDNRNRVGFKSASFLEMLALVPDPKSGRNLNPGGKFNFVFVDGHVETLTKAQTVGKGSIASPKGLWTVDPAD